MQTPAHRQIPALDGIRAVAIGLVVLFHCYETRLPGGRVGVDLFFILSGFLITRSLDCERAAHGKVRLGRFYLRRLCRLGPALYVMVAIWLLASALVGLDLAPRLVGAAIAGSYTMNLILGYDTFALPAVGQPVWDLNHTWSLAVEEQFYLLWPFAFVLLPRRWLLRLLCPAIGTVVVWRLLLVHGGAAPSRLYYGFDTRCDGLLLGCALALIPDWPTLARLATRTAPVPLAAIMVYAIVGDPPASHAALLHPTMIVASAWLIYAACQPGLLSSALSLPPLRYIGRISYGIYLWHFPVLWFAKQHFPGFHREEIVLVAASFGAAALSLHFLERPALSWITTRRPAAPALRASLVAAG